jgi:NitT/TauT family transport system ATP-binding protein
VAAPKAISLLSERPPVTAVLSAIGIAKSFGEHTIIWDLTFAAKEGEFVAVVGPSGCGKTTLLMCIAGLLKIDRGTVEFQGARITAPPPGLAVVFQDYSRSLLPWKSNMENVIFGMKRLEDVGSKEKRYRAIELLASVGLRGFEQHYPWQVSGGMQQRVAIARALAANSKLLLLDEPLAAVDAQTRADMQDLLLELAARYKQTCVLVTHDVDEAVYVADRAIVLSNRPAHVLEEFIIPLSSSRDQIVTRSDPIFLDIRAKILSQIKSLKGAGMNPDMIN